MYMKECRSCLKVKPDFDFRGEHRNRDGLFSYCKPCERRLCNKRQKKRRSQNPEVNRRANLMKNFGITLEQYNDMLAKQNNVCAICGRKETGMNNRGTALMNLAVDHDHKNRKIRGLLCCGCNRGIGFFKENPTFMYNAIKYLDMSQ